MSEKKKLYKVQVWLKSQNMPIEYETDWYHIDENELNHPGKKFIKIRDNYLSKDDILKILKVSVREADVSDPAFNDAEMPF